MTRPAIGQRPSNWIEWQRGKIVRQRTYPAPLSPAARDDAA
jgi:phage baseplate assembly protein gpV